VSFIFSVHVLQPTPKFGQLEQFQDLNLVQPTKFGHPPGQFSHFLHLFEDVLPTFFLWWQRHFHAPSFKLRHVDTGLAPAFKSSHVDAVVAPASELSMVWLLQLLPWNRGVLMLLNPGVLMLS
jgi:hypothetical protein